MNELTIITADMTNRLLSWDLAIESVRIALESIANGDSHLFPVHVMHGTAESDIFAVKAGVERLLPLVGFKFGGYWPGNAEKELPAHCSTTVLLDPDTGYPQALVSGRIVNLYRTAAADAIAVSQLSREDATVLGVLGGGHQAEYEIRAIAEVRPLSLVKIFTRSRERGEWITRQLGDLDTEIQLVSDEEAVRGSDIVVTVTPSTAPVVQSDWVEEGTHISAMGADITGKQELPPDILLRAKLFADYPEQSQRIGEFQHVFNDGLLPSMESVCPLGLVTQGKRAGRTCESDITVFDSSGIAIQDLTIARALYDRALEQGLATPIDF